MQSNTTSHPPLFLVIGATGHIGFPICNAIIDQGYWLRILVREKPNDSKRNELISKLKSRNCEIAKGDLYDLESVKKALRDVQVVICAVGIEDVLQQKALLPILQEYQSKTHNLKRFIPSEFGVFYKNLVDENNQVVKLLQPKAQVQEAVQQSGLPYTFVANGIFTEWVWSFSDAFVVGDGNRKGFVTAIKDIAAITVKAALDDRALNKTLGIIGEELTQNQLIQYYEAIHGSTKQRRQMTEENIVKEYKDALAKGDNYNAFYYLLIRALWVDGGGLQELKKVAVLANNLYPDYKFTSVKQSLSNKS